MREGWYFQEQVVVCQSAVKKYIFCALFHLGIRGTLLPGKRDLHIKGMGVLITLLALVKKLFFGPLSVLSLKQSTVGVFAVPFRLLSPKNQLYE